MRNQFARSLERLAATDPRVVLLMGDIGNRLFQTFEEHFPERFYNCGIAEGNMLGVAAGMALSGMRPIAYTIVPFFTTRALEQVKLDLAWHHAPVIMVGVGGGLSYAGLGPSHHSFEDIAILRVIPGMTIVCPSDPMEVDCALDAALSRDGPVYIRIGKKNEKLLHSIPPLFEIGRAMEMRQGKDVAIVSTGTILANVLDAAVLLERQGKSAEVIHMHTVKPLDGAALDMVFSRFSRIVVVEEHSRIGGLGSAVAQWSNDKHKRYPAFLHVALPDQFLNLIGNRKFAHNVHGLSAEGIVERVLAGFEW